MKSCSDIMLSSEKDMILIGAIQTDRHSFHCRPGKADVDAAQLDSESKHVEDWSQSFQIHILRRSMERQPKGQGSPLGGDIEIAHVKKKKKKKTRGVKGGPQF